MSNENDERVLNAILNPNVPFCAKSNDESNAETTSKKY